MSVWVRVWSACVCRSNVVIVVVILLLPSPSLLSSLTSWLRLSSSTPHNIYCTVICVCVVFLYGWQMMIVKRTATTTTTNSSSSNILHFNALNSISSQRFIILIFRICFSPLFCYVDRNRLVNQHFKKWLISFGVGFVIVVRASKSQSKLCKPFSFGVSFSIKILSWNLLFNRMSIDVWKLAESKNKTMKTASTHKQTRTQPLNLWFTKPLNFY